MADKLKSRKKFKISGKLILNIAVALISVYLIVYFFVSENGMIDLLSTPGSFNLAWLIAALIVYDMNMIIDTVVTYIFIRTQFKDFRFTDALKVAFVGVFFAAITPSSTGGQPMQLYLLSKNNIGVGFGSACMTQKFIVYQIISAGFSVFSVFARFEYFQSVFTNFWSTLFVILGFTVQMIVTAVFLIISFSRKLTQKLMKLVDLILKKLKFIKNADGIMNKIRTEVDTFHSANKILLGNAKLLAVTYILVFFQVAAMLSVPYFIYISFGMPQIAAANGEHIGTLFDFICIQSFVLFTSNLVLLPGASGGAELAFTMYFSCFFNVGGVNKIKPAILLWRFVTYYGSLIISAPFSYFTKGKKAEDEKERLPD